MGQIMKPQTMKPQTTKANPELEDLKDALRDYLNEYDNPIQDLTMKRAYLNRLRSLVKEDV